jgi:hypothetical protein
MTFNEPTEEEVEAAYREYEGREQYQWDSYEASRDAYLGVGDML